MLVQYLVKEWAGKSLAGALQNEKGSHLHWELFFDDKSGRYFLGQNIPSDLLKINIEQLFQ